MQNVYSFIDFLYNFSQFPHLCQHNRLILHSFLKNRIIIIIIIIIIIKMVK